MARSSGIFQQKAGSIVTIIESGSRRLLMLAFFKPSVAAGIKSAARREL
jgi:hypothetical protein